jgi:hypothetical protein
MLEDLTDVRWPGRRYRSAGHHLAKPNHRLRHFDGRAMLVGSSVEDHAAVDIDRLPDDGAGLL